MPKMVRFHELGGPEGLRIEERPLKQPGWDAAKVQAIGLSGRSKCFLSALLVHSEEWAPCSWLTCTSTTTARSEA